MAPTAKPKSAPATDAKSRVKVQPNAHVVIRVRSEEGMTVAAHRDVIATHGKVLFAKIGKELSPLLISQLQRQLAEGVPTLLFLATFDGWKAPFAFYQCELAAVYEAASPKLLRYVPRYLKDQVNSVGTWLEVTSIRRVAPDEIKQIYILTSGREVAGALRGATSSFRVGLATNAPLRTIHDLPPKLTKKNPDYDADEADESPPDELDQFRGFNDQDF
jgi:hypothetical protein